MATVVSEIYSLATPQKMCVGGVAAPLTGFKCLIQLQECRAVTRTDHAVAIYMYVVQFSTRLYYTSVLHIHVQLQFGG